MEDMKGFSVLNKSSSSRARAGVYNICKAEKRTSIATPNFLIPTSRGVIPHLTPDNVIKHTQPSGLFVGAEDFLEKLPNIPPIFKFPGHGRHQMCVPSEIPVIVSPRRSVPVASPKPNSDESLCIMTAEGFRQLPIKDYHLFVEKFGPDIAFAAPDIPNLSPGGLPGGNRVRKMLFRTEKWLAELLTINTDLNNPDIFAAILPSLDPRSQMPYLDFIMAHKDQIKGLCFWDIQSHNRLSQKMLKSKEEANESKDSSEALGATSNSSSLYPYIDFLDSRGLGELPRFSTSSFSTPQEALELISEGFDLLLGDFCTGFTDAGVALDFTFPPSTTHNASFGRNLWDPIYTSDSHRLGADTPNVTGNHHRAYIHHLLDAREMTAWVLLQIHNLSVSEQFFQGIRQSILDKTFDQERFRFEQVYGTTEQALTLRDAFKTKQSLPKARGYSTSFEDHKQREVNGISSKINDPVFRPLQ